LPPVLGTIIIKAFEGTKKFVYNFLTLLIEDDVINVYLWLCLQNETKNEKIEENYFSKSKIYSFWYFYRQTQRGLDHILKLKASTEKSLVIRPM